MDQAAGFALWIGMAVFALVWGNVHLWHTRRVLRRLRQEVTAQTRMAPAAGTDPSSAPAS